MKRAVENQSMFVIVGDYVIWYEPPLKALWCFVWIQIGHITFLHQFLDFLRIWHCSFWVFQEMPFSSEKDLLRMKRIQKELRLGPIVSNPVSF